MKIRIILSQVLLILASATAAVLADGLAGPAGLDLGWHTVDAGGGDCSDGSNLKLSATIGQPDASSTLVGGPFELVGGFWPGVIEPADCPPDIAGNDGLVNIDDLLLVINNWGQGPGSPGDVNHSGGVNIDDLLAIVNAWGACP